MCENKFNLFEIILNKTIRNETTWGNSQHSNQHLNHLQCEPLWMRTIESVSCFIHASIEGFNRFSMLMWCLLNASCTLSAWVHCVQSYNSRCIWACCRIEHTICAQMLFEFSIWCCNRKNCCHIDSSTENDKSSTFTFGQSNPIGMNFHLSRLDGTCNT